MNALLIGLGSIDRGDDGVGVAVARHVASMRPPGVDVVEVDDPSALLDAWQGAECVVVVDAVDSGRPPGTLHAIHPDRDALPTGGWSASGTHALGLAAAVELSRALGRLPDHLVVVGVEIDGEQAIRAQGAGLSPAVAAAVGPSAVLALTELAEGGR